MKLTVGRIVHYKLSASDCQTINESRNLPNGMRRAGNPVQPGDIVPAIVVHVWPNEYGPDYEGFNGQAFLDGSDTLWLTSVKEGPGEGQWQWPVIEGGPDVKTI